MSDDGSKYAREVMEAALLELDWNDPVTYDEEESRCLYDTGVMIHDQRFELYCSIDDELDLATVYMYAPLRVPHDRMADTLMLVNFINTRLLLGLLNVFEDGQIQFRCRIDVEGGKLAPLMVISMVDAAIKTYREWFERIALVVLGSTTAEQVIGQVQSEDKQLEDRRKASLH